MNVKTWNLHLSFYWRWSVECMYDVNVALGVVVVERISALEVRLCCWRVKYLTWAPPTKGSFCTHFATNPQQLISSRQFSILLLDLLLLCFFFYWVFLKSYSRKRVRYEISTVLWLRPQHLSLSLHRQYSEITVSCPPKLEVSIFITLSFLHSELYFSTLWTNVVSCPFFIIYFDSFISTFWPSVATALDSASSM